MSKRANPAIIGAFVVGAVALAVVAVSVLGSGRLFRRTHQYVLYFDSDVSGLRVGAPVKFKGVEIGSVTGVLLNVGAAEAFRAPSELEKMHIPVLIELDEDRIRERGGRANLEDPDFLRRLIDAGLRAQLAMESFVTGLLYVKLDLLPQTTPRLIADPSVPYQEIPTVPTPLEEVQMKASRFLARLEEVDLARLAHSLTEAVEGINDLVNSPKLDSALEALDGAIQSLDRTAQSVRDLAEELDRNLVPTRERLEATARDAGETLKEGRVALRELRDTLAADSPLLYELTTSLKELSAAARAVRSLAEYLERNPSALVRGKPVAQEAR